MEQPDSLTKERARKLLPKLVIRKGRSHLRYPEMTPAEAQYILFLDQVYTSTEIASILTGSRDLNIGIQLVTSAERRMGSVNNRV